MKEPLNYKYHLARIRIIEDFFICIVQNLTDGNGTFQTIYKCNVVESQPEIPNTIGLYVARENILYSCNDLEELKKNWGIYIL